MKLKKAIFAVLCGLMIISLVACTGTYTETTTVVNENLTASEDNSATTEENSEVTISAEVQEYANDTKQSIVAGEDIATDEIISADEADEDSVVDEGALEADGTVEQENIPYNGTQTGNGKSLLGACTGLTYYSQADSRWANVLYTSTNNSTQTIKSSGCGPTSAAMIVSSSKGAILPTTMAQLFVDNGYRTASNGTAWSCWSFVADYFGFDEYYTTTSDSKMLSYLSTDKNNDGTADYFVVASCGSGLFTTSGHYIVLVADNDGTMTVYDPYLYSGKFTTASRKAANVTVSGNSAFVSESNFKKYANAKQYWIFSNDYTATTASTSNSTGSASASSTATTVSYTRYVATKSSNLNVRAKAKSTAKIKTTLKRGTKVKVTKTKGNWSYITSPSKGWVSTAYLSATKVTTTTYKTKVGSKYRLKAKSTLYSKGTLSGTKYTYYAQTQVKVLKHYSSTVDYVQVVKTGRKAYVKVNKLNT